MKLAIMQPYIFPYIGYFQLVYAVDSFVFYDDVNFIKRGWINRNNVLINGKAHLLSFPCIGASQNKLINEVGVDLHDKQYAKLEKSVEMAYKQAPYFNEVMPIINGVFNSGVTNIAQLAALSITSVCVYLELDRKFMFSSEDFHQSRGLDKADRLINISRQLNADQYINAIGGMELYDKPYFKKEGINLSFLKPNLGTYNQFEEPFVPGLSIIDVLMFNSKIKVREILANYELV